MAYKAPKGLSSAIRGRSMVKRDYGSQIKFDAYQRERKREAQRSGLGLIQGIAAGAAQVGKVAETRLKGWEQLEAGAEKVFESGGGEAVHGEFVSPTEGMSGWDKLFSDVPAGEVYKIGERGFFTSQLKQIGGMAGESSEMLSKGGKSLYESVGGELSNIAQIESYLSGSEGPTTGYLKDLFGEDYGTFMQQTPSLFQSDYLNPQLNPQSPITTTF